MSEMTAEQYGEAHAKEYAKYVATEPIDLRGARAFNPGDPVPVGHVEGHSRPGPDGTTITTEPVVRKDQVSGANTKAAQAAKES